MELLKKHESGEWDEPSQMNKEVAWSPEALTFMAHKPEAVLHTPFTLKAVLRKMQAAEDFK